mmetsp:Transcript_8127/g.26655  ORF Transcript_8127/g.26655 Transcript_8127/m.26655 type:complete len:261 (-) Transcript_8127:770-1552(-)
MRTTRPQLRLARARIEDSRGTLNSRRASRPPFSPPAARPREVRRRRPFAAGSAARRRPWFGRLAHTRRTAPLERRAAHRPSPPPRPTRCSPRRPARRLRWRGRWRRCTGFPPTGRCPGDSHFPAPRCTAVRLGTRPRRRVALRWASGARADWRARSTPHLRRRCPAHGAAPRRGPRLRRVAPRTVDSPRADRPGSRRRRRPAPPPPKKRASPNPRRTPKRPPSSPTTARWPFRTRRRRAQTPSRRRSRGPSRGGGRRGAR